MQKRLSTTLAPSVARLVAINNLSNQISSIKASGPKGNILKGDVLEFLKNPSSNTKSLSSSTSTTSASSLSSSMSSSKSSSRAKRRPRADISQRPFDSITPSQTRSIIAKRLTSSKFSIPHYYLSKTICIDNIVEWRKNEKQKNEKEKVPSVNDFVIKASASALRKVDILNANKSNEKGRKSCDVAFAVAVPGASEALFSGALITPIVKGAERLGVRAIQQQTQQLIGKARANKLTPDEYQGGSFCVSNLGMYDVKEFTAIINPPHAGILAVGAPQLVLDEAGQRRTHVTVTLSVDAAQVESPEAAAWLDAFAAALREPMLHC